MRQEEWKTKKWNGQGRYKGRYKKKGEGQKDKKENIMCDHCENASQFITSTGTSFYLLCEHKRKQVCICFDQTMSVINISKCLLCQRVDNMKIWAFAVTTQYNTIPNVNHVIWFMFIWKRGFIFRRLGHVGSKNLIIFIFRYANFGVFHCGHNFGLHFLTGIA